MKSSRQRILILDGESNAARAVLQSLGRAGHECWLAGMDTSGAAFASRYPTRELLYPDPLTDKAEFLEWLTMSHTERRFDLVLPVTEATFVPLHELRLAHSPGANARQALTAVVVLPPANAVDTVLDKEALHQTAMKLDIPVPVSRYFEPGMGVESVLGSLSQSWPRVVKPVRSKLWFGSRGTSLHARIARDPDELRRVLHGLLPLTGVQVQEWFPGHGLGIEALVRHGEVVQMFAHERLHEVPLTGGGSSYRRSVVPPAALEEATKRLLGHLGWHGVGMVEFRVDPKTNRAALLEVNGRFWGSLPLAVFAGADFPVTLVEMWRERAVAVPPVPSRTVFARQVTSDTQWMKMALRNVRHPDPLVEHHSLGRAAFEWGRFLTGREIWDGASRRDPWPLVREITALWKTEIRGAMTRVRNTVRVRRRRKAMRRRFLARRTARHILVLCHGNICRSPYVGAQLAARVAALGLEVRTAGFSRYTGRTAPEMYQRLVASRGVDLRTHRSRRVEGSDLSWADLLLVMDAANERELKVRDARRVHGAVTLGALDPAGGDEIADPYELSAQEASAVLDQMDRCVEALVAALAQPGAV